MIRFAMALRNTVRQPRRTLLLGGAIAFGVMVICLASGFTSGMERSVQDNVTLYSAGHILVSGFQTNQSGRLLNKMSDDALADKIRELVPGALSIARTAQTQATVVFGSREQQLRVRGIDWKADKLYSSSLILVQGEWASVQADRAILLGAQSARRFGLGLGDSVFVKLQTASGQQNVTEYRLGGVYDDSAAGGMTTALVPLADLVSDLNLQEGEYQSLAIFLDDASAAETTAKALSAGLSSAGFTMMDTVQNAFRARPTQGSQEASAATAAPAESGEAPVPGSGAAGRPDFGSGGFTPGGAGADASGAPRATMGGGFGRNLMGQLAGKAVYRMTTVTQMSGQLGAVLGSVRWIGATIFAIMLLLTAAGITNTYRMVLMERTREIGMLRCIGFRRRDIFRIFIYEAVIIAFAGSLAGILISLPIGAIGQLLAFDPSGSLGAALSRGHLLFVPSIVSFAIVCAAVALSSILAVSGPARKASKLLPVEALRATA